MLTKLEIPTAKQAKVFDEKVVLEAIDGSYGLYSTVAENLGCAPITAKQNIRYYKSTIIAFEEQDDMLADSAMRSLKMLIKDGDPATVRWVLKYLRPEKFADELPGLVDQSITVNISLPEGLSIEEAIETAKKLKKLKGGK